MCTSRDAPSCASNAFNWARGDAAAGLVRANTPAFDGFLAEQERWSREVAVARDVGRERRAESGFPIEPSPAGDPTAASGHQNNRGRRENVHFLSASTVTSIRPPLRRRSVAWHGSRSGNLPQKPGRAEIGRQSHGSRSRPRSKGTILRSEQYPLIRSNRCAFESSRACRCRRGEVLRPQRESRRRRKPSLLGRPFSSRRGRRPFRASTIPAAQPGGPAPTTITFGRNSIGERL